MQDRLLLVKLALRAYYVEHGAYPDTLAALVSAGYLTQVPADPFSLTGDAPRYKHPSPTCYLLYSVGPDGKDDGGTPIRFTTGKLAGQTQSFVNGTETGDFVVGQNVP